MKVMKVKVRRVARARQHMSVTVVFSPRFLSRRELHALCQEIRAYTRALRHRPLGRELSSIRVMTCEGALVINMLFKHAYNWRGAYREHHRAAKEIASRIQIVIQAFDRLCAMEETRPKGKRRR